MPTASHANDGAPLPVTVSVYADRAHLREVMRDDAAAAGLAALDRLDDDFQRIDLAGFDQLARRHLCDISGEGIA